MTSAPEVDMISFTGSTGVGRAAMAAAAATLKRVSMELGGKNPQVIFPDADMDAALDAATFGAWFNAGECCNAGSRLLLHAPSPKISRATGEARGASEGRRPARRDARRRADQRRPPGQDRDACGGGASGRRRLRIGGERLASNGLFMAPAIVAERHAFDGDRQRRSVRAGRGRADLRDAGEAIELANATDYGSRRASGAAISTPRSPSAAACAPAPLGQHLHGRHARTAVRRLSQSGVGRELGRNAVKDYTEEKTFHVHKGPRTSWWLAWRRRSGAARRLLQTAPDRIRRESTFWKGTR